MRTLCDVCEGAAAIVFCAADEAALCRSCDEKVLHSFFSFFICNFIYAKSDSLFDTHDFGEF